MKVLNKISADFDNTINESDANLRNIRVENFDEFQRTGIPTSKEEFWKYTDPSIVKNSEFSLGIPNNIENNDFDIVIVNSKVIKNKLNHQYYVYPFALTYMKYSHLYQENQEYL